MLTLALCLFFQDAEAVLRKLSDDSVETRQEAAAALVRQGRTAVPVVRQVLAKASGHAKLEAESVLSRISSNEVSALLAKEKIQGLRDLQTIKDEAVARLRPGATLYLLATSKGFDDSGGRVIVVNDLAEENGAPRLLKSEADIVPILPMKGTNKEEVAGIARAALFLLRAMHPCAHDPDLVPGGSTGIKGNQVDWSKPEAYPLAQKDGAWRLENVAMKFGHDYNVASLAFDKEGRLAEIKVTYTGVS